MRVNTSLWQNHGWRGDGLALLAGASITYSLAPFNLWALSLFAPAALLWLIQSLKPKPALWRCFVFGLGMFGQGTSWVFISIHKFGNTDLALALVMTALFVIALALVFALPFYPFARFFSATTAGRLLGFSAIWVLGEWSRSWFLTGFPWLYLGYAHIETWLAGWAPVWGVFGLSLIAVLSALSLSEALQLRKKIIHRDQRLPLVLTVFSLLLWLIGGALHLRPLDNNGQAISVAIVQPNIPMEKKWDPLYQDEIMDILRNETNQHWDKDLIIWPEAAVPLMYHDAEYFFEEMATQSLASNTGIITGILYDDATPLTYFNSIVGLGRADGIYFKQRLVPFGEYVPLEKWLRGLIDFFNLPNSIIFPGPKHQDILSFDSFQVAPSICYEIVYPDLVAKLAKDADLLITISNDAWFGDSIGPVQHFQMAQMRALENHLYVLRGTNTGISGIIDPKGKVTLLGERSVRETISQSGVVLKRHHTLFSTWGSWPVVLMCFLIIAALSLANGRLRQNHLVGLPD